MSTAPTPPPASSAPPKREITLISHSMLFYWWPIWVLGFALALVTYFEDHRIAIVPARTTITKEKGDDKATFYQLGILPGTETKSLEQAVERSKPTPSGEAVNAFPTRVSELAWMGPVFCVVLLLTVVITNVPLRGLWSFLVLLMLLIVALLITLVPNGWERLLGTLGNLHIYINMAGYLFIAIVVFILWAVSVFIFDQRTYMVIKPGQI